MEHALFDVPRPGKPRRYDTDVEAKIAALACSQPPTGAQRWTLVLLEQAARAQPGMKHEKEPARPPAATTRMSSGDCTSGRVAVSSSGFTAPGNRAVRLKCATVFVVFSKMNLRMSAFDQLSAAIVRMCSPASTTQ